jgi:hypothetical protein
MITEIIKQQTKNRAASHFLLDGEYSIESQIIRLEEASPLEMHVPGVDLCTVYAYENAKDILKRIEEVQQDFLEMYEQGYKDAGAPWEPNIQKITKQ